MTFRFKSKAIKNQYKNGYVIPEPTFLREVYGQLIDEAETWSLDDPTEGVWVYPHSHYTAIVCSLVDWTGAIAAKRICTRASLEELLVDPSFGRDESERDAFLQELESWYLLEGDVSLFVSPEKYPPIDGCSPPPATIGNICAVFGLAVLDRLLVRQDRLCMQDALFEYGIVWKCAMLATNYNRESVRLFYDAYRGVQQI